MEKVRSQSKTHLFAKGTRKTLAIKRGKLIWKVLVVYDRKYHIFSAPSAGSQKVVQGRNGVQLPKKTEHFTLFFVLGTLQALGTSAAHSQVNCKLRAPGIIWSERSLLQ